MQMLLTECCPPKHTLSLLFFLPNLPTNIMPPLWGRDENHLRASITQEAVADWGFWGPGMALDGS